MEGLKDTFELLWVICGPLYLIATLVLGLALSGIAIYLVFIRRSPQLLAVFLPLTFFPLFLGAFRTLLALSATIALIRASGSTTGEVGEGVMMMGMSFLPLLFSLIVSLPAFMLVSAGRAQMVWKANGTLSSSPQPKSATVNAAVNSERDLQVDTERYLARLSSRD